MKTLLEIGVGDLVWCVQSQRVVTITDASATSLTAESRRYRRRDGDDGFGNCIQALTSQKRRNAKIFRRGLQSQKLQPCNL